MRGVDGASRVQVDAAGQPTGGILSERDPLPGNDLVLSIDDRVQTRGRVGDRQPGPARAASSR